MSMGSNYETNENSVIVTGVVSDWFEFSHELHGENFYMFHVESKRNSGTIDYIPVMVSEKVIDVSEDFVGQEIKINGSFRSYNKHTEKGNKLILFVFAKEIEFLEDGDVNEISLDGYICKEPLKRETPLGREICDILLAVNRAYGKTDYVPCITWGRNANFASTLKIGQRIRVSGRIQSREYEKRIDGFTKETRVAYEVSVSRIETVN